MFIFNGANVAAHNIKLHQTGHQRYIYLFGTTSVSPASVAVLVQALRRTNAHCTNIVRFICLGQLWFRLEDVTVALRRTNAKCTNTVIFICFALLRLGKVTVHGVGANVAAHKCKISISPFPRIT